MHTRIIVGRLEFLTKKKLQNLLKFPNSAREKKTKESLLLEKIIHYRGGGGKTNIHPWRKLPNS